MTFRNLRSYLREVFEGQICLYSILTTHLWGFKNVAQLVKSLTALQETWVREDPLEKEMATHFSILAWRIPWTEEPGWLQSMELQELDMSEQL